MSKSIRSFARWQSLFGYRQGLPPETHNLGSGSSDSEPDCQFEKPLRHEIRSDAVEAEKQRRRAQLRQRPRARGTECACRQEDRSSVSLSERRIPDETSRGRRHAQDRKVISRNYRSSDSFCFSVCICITERCCCFSRHSANHVGLTAIVRIAKITACLATFDAQNQIERQHRLRRR